jgi:hypothetical protein
LGQHLGSVKIRRMSFKKRKLFTLREYLGSPLVFGGVCFLFFTFLFFCVVFFCFVLYLVSNVACVSRMSICSYGFYIGATESCWVVVGTATGLCEENHYTVYKPYESEFFTTTLLTRLYVRVNILLILTCTTYCFLKLPFCRNSSKIQ